MPGKVCPTESKMGQICAKNIPPEANASIPEANRKNTKFVVTVDDCRTQNWTCWNPINGNVTYEPDFGADPMFPPVGHFFNLYLGLEERKNSCCRTHSQRISEQVGPLFCT